MRPLRLLPTFFTVALLLSPALARADELADLKTRFQSRDAQVQTLKTAGQVGETSQGVLETPPAAPAMSKADTKLVAEENTDRKRLYELLAAKEGATADLVATRAAQRNFSRAKTGEWLKFPDGSWRQRK